MRQGRASLRGRRLLLLALVLATACGPRRIPPPTPATVQGVFLAGYHPYWGGDSWQGYPLDLLHRLYFFEVELASDGTVSDPRGWPGDWTTLLEAARERGVDFVPSVGIHGEGAFEDLFGDPAARARAVDTVVGLVAGVPGVDGVHLDMEIFRPVPDPVREGYTAFVAEVASRLTALDPELVLSVFALAFDDADVYDEPALAALSDYLVVQGYDLHNLNDTRAGPLAALEGWGRLNWARVVDRFQEMGIPGSKLVMGVPLYGYQWPTTGPEPGAPTRGPGVALPLTAPPDVLPELPRAREQAAIHGLRRDPASDIPYYAYRSGEGWVQGWFEDERSLRAKLDFVRSRGLGGMALFPLSYGDEGVWRILEEARRGSSF